MICLGDTIQSEMVIKSLGDRQLNSIYDALDLHKTLLRLWPYVSYSDKLYNRKSIHLLYKTAGNRFRSGTMFQDQRNRKGDC